jgi:hypothetical protein
MIFTEAQIRRLIESIDKKIVLFSAQLGTNLLNESERELLKSMGLNLNKLYLQHKDPLFLQYQLGMLAKVIGKSEVNKISKNKLASIIKEGKHIPLTPSEKYALDSVKRQSLSDIRSLKGRIYNDVNGSILSNERDNRLAQEQVIRKEIERGVVERKSRREVAQELGNKTGDWARNFNRIVQYVSHQAFAEGKIAIAERKYGEEARIWMDVYSGACKHCIKAYLTAGIGSKPKVFTVKKLKANGTNIGRKVADWQAVIPPQHPQCRCSPNLLEEGEEWNEEKNDFIVPKDKDYESKIRKTKIEVTFNGETRLV